MEFFKSAINRYIPVVMKQLSAAEIGEFYLKLIQNKMSIFGFYQKTLYDSNQGQVF